MNAQLFEELVMLHNRVCMALGDPKRLMILYCLNGHPHSVKELAQQLDTPQPTISHHLKILRERSIVKTQREGTTIFYSLTDPRVIQAVDLLRAVLHDISHKQAEIATFKALDTEFQDVEATDDESHS